MKQKKLFSCLLGLLFSCTLQAQVPVTDEGRVAQLKAMELGEINFSPKWYYAFMHNHSTAWNLGLGQNDKYSWYDYEWQWSGFKSGYHLKFKPKKSKATNLQPLRMSGLVTLIDQNKRTKETLDSLREQFNWYTSRETDCVMDKTYPAFKQDFEVLQNRISANLTNCYALRDCTDNDGQIEECTLLFNMYKEHISTIRSAHMENAYKLQAYNKILTQMRYLNNRTLQLSIKATLASRPSATVGTIQGAKQFYKLVYG